MTLAWCHNAQTEYSTPESSPETAPDTHRLLVPLRGVSKWWGNGREREAEDVGTKKGGRTGDSTVARNEEELDHGGVLACAATWAMSG